MAKKTFIVTGNILHNHQLYQPGDSITFDTAVDSEETIAELKRAGNLGGKEGRALERKRILAEEASGVTGMTDQQMSRLWQSTTGMSAQQLRAHERDEARVKETAEGARRANVDDQNPAQAMTEKREQEKLDASKHQAEEERAVRDVNTDTTISNPVDAETFNALDTMSGTETTDLRSEDEAEDEIDAEAEELEQEDEGEETEETPPATLRKERGSLRKRATPKTSLDDEEF